MRCDVQAVQHDNQNQQRCVCQNNHSRKPLRQHFNYSQQLRISTSQRTRRAAISRAAISRTRRHNILKSVFKHLHCIANLLVRAQTVAILTGTGAWLGWKFQDSAVHLGAGELVLRLQTRCEIVHLLVCRCGEKTHTKKLLKVLFTNPFQHFF